MKIFSSTREKRLWTITALVVLAIYASLAKAPEILDTLTEANLASEVFILAFFILVAAVAWQALVTWPRWSELWVALAIIGVYLFAWVRFQIPERTHLFEYSVVALLIYRALDERKQQGAFSRSIAIWALTAAASLGFIDELIQGLLPRRHFEWIDVGFNALAAFMAILSSEALRWIRARSSSD